MKLHRVIIIVVLAALVVGLFVAPALAKPKDTSSISGQITTAAGQAVAAGSVVVKAWTIDWLWVPDWEDYGYTPVVKATTLVGAGGAYTFSGLAPGAYRIEAYPTDRELATSWYSGKKQAAPSVWTAKEVVLTGKKSAKNIKIELAAAAHIKGRVVDESGNPIAGVGVAAIVQPGWVLYPNSDYVTTGPDGTYDIPGLAAIAGVEPPGYGTPDDPHYYCPPDTGAHGYFLIFGVICDGNWSDPFWQFALREEPVSPMAGETITVPDMVLYPK